MKASLVAAMAAAVAVVACTSKTTVVRPVTQAPPPAPTVVITQPQPQPPPVVAAAPLPGQLIVTYALPAGFPAAQQSAIAYCREHYGSTGAAIVSDDHAGRATFACTS